MSEFISRADITSYTANLFITDDDFTKVNKRRLTVEDKLILVQAISIEARTSAFDRIETEFNVIIEAIDFSDCISFVVKGDCDWMPLLDAFKAINNDIILGREHKGMQTFFYEVCVTEN